LYLLGLSEVSRDYQSPLVLNKLGDDTTGIDAAL